MICTNYLSLKLKFRRKENPTLHLNNLQNLPGEKFNFAVQGRHVFHILNL